MLKNNFYNIKSKLILIVILSIIGRTLWHKGPLAAGDYHYWFQQELETMFGFPLTWRNILGAEGMGQNVVSTLWLWPVVMIYAIFSKVGFSFSHLARIFGVIPIFLTGIYSIDKLLNYFRISKKSRFLGALLYLTNTYILLLVDGGQLFIAMAYSILPLAFLTYMEITDDSKYQNVFKFVLITIALSIFEIRAVVMLFFLITLKLLYDLLVQTKIDFRKVGVMGLTTGISLVGFHAYWILPSIISKESLFMSIPSLSSSTDVANLSSISNSLLLLQPHWFKNVFGQVVGQRAEFVVIPILAFAALLLIRKNKALLFWAIVALISVFLGKGATEPLENIYPLLLKNIPGFSFFRDPTKFYFLIALSYTILIGFSLDALMKKINLKIKVRSFEFRPLFVVVCTYLIILPFPLLQNKMTGLFALPVYEKELGNVSEILKNDNNFSRVLWIPNNMPLSYSSLTHPQALGYLFSEKRPFAVGRVGTYEIHNYLREASLVGELLDIAGIGYIAFPYPDTRREELKKDNIDYYYQFLDQISSKEWISGQVYPPPVAVLKTKSHQDRFFVAENTYLVVGSDRIYNDLSKVEGFKLSDNALVFTEEKKNFPEKDKLLKSFSLISYDKTQEDVSFVFAPFNDRFSFLFPSDQLDRDPDESGWWKRDSGEFVWFRNFLQEKYQLDMTDFSFDGGWAIAEGERELIIPVELKGREMLNVRLMASPKGGKVSFFTDDGRLMEEVETKVENDEKVKLTLSGYGKITNRELVFDKASFHWNQVGFSKIDPYHSEGSIKYVRVKTTGEINVINAIVPMDVSDGVNNLVENLGLKERLISWDKLTYNNKEFLFSTNQTGKRPSVTYEIVNPTHFKVKVQGLVKPSTLVFSETYDSLWKIANDGSHEGSAYPVYSLVNGFYIEKDGEYEIYYLPQKYVGTGLAVSIATLIFIGGAYVVVWQKNKNL